MVTSLVGLMLVVDFVKVVHYPPIFLSFVLSYFLMLFLWKESIGIQISPKGPKISHLLYADDIVIFSEANVKIVKEIKSILNKFCDWTGQKVNVSKLAILFGKSVKRRRKSILQIMGFKSIKEFSYLGVKVALRRL